MEKLAVGIIGAAGRGAGFFSAFQCNPATYIKALCDINEEGLKNTAKSIGVSEIYFNAEEMLDKADIDIVLIGTPMPYHVPQAIMALDRDIHVMSEVPAAVSLDEAKDLVLACRKSKATYMMAENYCYIRSNVLIKEIADAGLFGELYFGEGEYTHELKGLNEITKWRRKWQTGINGNTYCTHSLGPVYQWFGNERVTQVCSFGTGHHYTDPRGDQYEQEDAIFTSCRLEKGGLINLRLDMLSNRPHNMTYYTLQGTKGCYEAPRGPEDKHKIYLMNRHDEGTWHDPESLAEEFLPDKWLHPSKEALEAGHMGGDYMQVQDFVDAIITNTKPPIDIDKAMDITLVGLVSQQSIINGSIWMDVPDSRKW